MRVGRRYLAPANGFLGAIDELELFNRALGAQEIQRIFGAHSFGKCRPRTPPICVGDCGDKGAVSRSDLLTGITLALGGEVEESCTQFDRDEDGIVTVEEVVTAVRNSLGSCPQANAD